MREETGEADGMPSTGERSGALNGPVAGEGEASDVLQPHSGARTPW